MLIKVGFDSKLLIPASFITDDTIGSVMTAAIVTPNHYSITDSDTKISDDKFSYHNFIVARTGAPL